MVNMSWGLLGPEKLDSTRRTRTLGLGAAVRAFNDLAVPGLGGIWFGKQLFLAVLGIAVAEQVRQNGGQVTNITTANAIEALACWLALSKNGWKSDARLRGATKMQGKNDLAFAKVSQRSFYVTQPMRMASVQPLLALGLVSSNSQRFSSYSCSERGYKFIDVACSESNPCYYSKSVLDHLVGWAKKEHINVQLEKLKTALSPLYPLPKSAREILREQLMQGSGDESKRRRDALAWVESLNRTLPKSIAWNSKPDILTDEHWRDLRAGAKFFSARVAAIQLLDLVESHLARQSEPELTLRDELPGNLVKAAQLLQQHCQAFLDENHDPTQLAREFCLECVNDDAPALVLERLVKRDDRVLRLRGRQVVPGPAYRGKILPQSDDSGDPEEQSPEVTDQPNIPWPEGISERIKNLYWLNRDLQDELDGAITSAEVIP
jgi:hypothetical protein